MRLGFALLLLVPRALAQAGAGPVTIDADSPVPAVAVAADELSPPKLESRIEAQYPPDALDRRLEGDVGLELDVDETGKVTGVRVLRSLGNGFDESAIRAAEQFRFEPAKRAGVAIPSTIEFAYEFRLPKSAPAAATRAPVRPREVTQTGADQATVVLATRPISAASSFSVRDREFSLRPIGSVQDILRVTPGLVVVQHSGGGKANQYFLRGFDIDHGTDLALSIDGIPINMVSHAHGQGFADTNFIIPEAVERIEITKGPYFANQGDFATAGAVNFVTREAFEQSSVGFGMGLSPGHGAPSYRTLLVASPKLDAAKATFAAELGRGNGAFDNPERFDRYKLFNRVTFPVSKRASLSVGAMSYAGNWYGSGQIPARAIEQGLASRFGSIDPDEGGNSARHQLSAQYRLRPADNSELRALMYVAAYRFNLYSNFTLFHRDPDNGDEIEQVDRRTFLGGKASYRVVHELSGLRFDTTIGADLRNDDIRNQLFNTLHRSHLDTVRDNSVHQTLIGAFANEEVSPVDWLRLVVGGRADFVSFAVDDRLGGTNPTAPQSGVDGAHQLSPKASAIVTPLAEKPVELDVYANYGHGFHSNDVRGAFASPRVTPLTRAVGEEVGSRARLFDRWDLALALWQLDLDNETVWVGDEGTTEVGEATRRQGIEAETRFEITEWLAADLDVSFTRSELRENPGNAGGLALAPKQTWSGGLSARHPLGPGTARGGLRFFGIAERPASDDGVLVAEGFTQFDLHLGYRHRRFDVAMDVENLLNSRIRAAQFATVSRLRTEPAIGSTVPAGFSCGKEGRLASAPDGTAPGGRFFGCEDLSFTPAPPITLRVMATLFID